MNRKTKPEDVKKILKKEKVQSMLRYWKDDSTTWAQFRDLRTRYVVKDFEEEDYEKAQYRSSDGLYYDSKRSEIRKDRPMPLFHHDSQLSSTLNEMRECGILCRKKVPQERGKAKSFYRPSEKYRLDIVRLCDKNVIMNSPRNHVVTTGNIRFYLSQLPVEKIGPDELKNLNIASDHLYTAQLIMGDIIKSITEKKENEIWKKEVIDSNLIPPLIKFLFWVEYLLIRSFTFYPLFKTLWNGTKKAIIDDGLKEIQLPKILSANEDTQNILRRSAMQATYDFILKRYQTYEKDDLFRHESKMFDYYMNNYDSILRVIKQIHEMNKEFRIVVAPLVYLGLKSGEEIGKSNLIDTGLAHDYVMKNDNAVKMNNISPFSFKRGDEIDSIVTVKKDIFSLDIESPQPTEQKITQPNFFSKNNFFDVCKKELSELGIDINNLYEELDRLSGIFTVPQLPDDPQDLLNGKNLM